MRENLYLWHDSSNSQGRSSLDFLQEEVHRCNSSILGEAHPSTDWNLSEYWIQCRLKRHLQKVGKWSCRRGSCSKGMLPLALHRLPRKASTRRSRRLRSTGTQTLIVDQWRHICLGNLVSRCRGVCSHLCLHRSAQDPTLVSDHSQRWTRMQCWWSCSLSMSRMHLWCCLHRDVVPNTLRSATRHERTGIGCRWRWKLRTSSSRLICCLPCLGGCLRWMEDGEGVDIWSIIGCVRFVDWLRV